MEHLMGFFVGKERDSLRSWSGFCDKDIFRLISSNSEFTNFIFMYSQPKIRPYT